MSGANIDPNDIFKMFFGGGGGMGGGGMGGGMGGMPGFTFTTSTADMGGGSDDPFGGMFGRSGGGGR